MSAATNGAAVLDKVRAALAEAGAAGEPRPGRPTLVRLTGASDHQVRRALAALETETTTRSAGDDASPPAARQPGEALEIEAARTPPALISLTASAVPAGGGLAGAGGQPGGAGEPAPPALATEVTTPVGVSAVEHRAARQPRPWPLIIIGLAAAVAVWGGWVELGHLTGFGLVQPLPGLWDELRINTAIVLPLGIEAYGGYALRTWLSSAALSERTRSFVRWSAIASLVVGAGAQVASHLMRAASVTSAPPLVTVLVACVPVLVLGLATGLATLVKRDASAGGSGGDR